MTTTYLNVKTESQLSADIKAIDLASQKDSERRGRFIRSRSRKARP